MEIQKKKVNEENKINQSVNKQRTPTDRESPVVHMHDVTKKIPLSTFGDIAWTRSRTDGYNGQTEKLKPISPRFSGGKLTRITADLCGVINQILHEIMHTVSYQCMWSEILYIRVIGLWLNSRW